MFVLDASIIGAVLIPDERGRTTWRLDDLLSAQAVVPLHASLEVANLIAKAKRQRRISAEEARQAHDLGKMILAAVTIEHDLPADAVFRLALSRNISFYDADYVELAARSRLPLLAADRGMAKAALAEGVELVAA